MEEIKQYLRNELKIKEEQIDEYIEDISKYDDIFNEFCAIISMFFNKRGEQSWMRSVQSVLIFWQHNSCK